MGVQLLSIEGSQVKMKVIVELSRSMLTSKENIQHSLNEVGCIATVSALKYLDTDGSALEIASDEIGSVVLSKRQLTDFQIKLTEKVDLIVTLASSVPTAIPP